MRSCCGRETVSKLFRIEAGACVQGSECSERALPSAQPSTSVGRRAHSSSTCWKGWAMFPCLPEHSSTPFIPFIPPPNRFFDLGAHSKGHRSLWEEPGVWKLLAERLKISHRGRDLQPDLQIGREHTKGFNIWKQNTELPNSFLWLTPGFQLLFMFSSRFPLFVSWSRFCFALQWEFKGGARMKNRIGAVSLLVLILQMHLYGMLQGLWDPHRRLWATTGPNLHWPEPDHQSCDQKP